MGKRAGVWGVLLAGVMLLSGAAFAGPLDSIAIDPQATTLHSEETVTVPSNGAVGSDVSVTSRAFLSIDFAVEPNKQVTLLVITAAQKQEMNAGSPITGRPKVRTPIDGTASQSLTVDEGDYYVAILNADSQPASVTYRVSARAF
ncbi:MAG: hypothetical protein WCA81_02670 [Rhizomicrobium sp.]|jgi:hypothetical protein